MTLLNRIKQISTGDIYIYLLGLFMLVNMKMEYRWQDHFIIRHDVSGYYNYLPGAFLRNNLYYENHADIQGKEIHLAEPNKTPDGRLYNKYTMGMAYMYTPFFMGSVVCAKISGHKIDGYTVPFQIGILLSGWFYMILGLLYTRRILRFFYSEQVALLTVTLVAFATNLLYYGTYEAGMTHTADFALFAALIYYSWKHWLVPKKRYFAAIILTVSLLTLIRPVNGLAVLIPLFFNSERKFALKKHLQYAISSKINIALTALILFLVFFPQLLYWKMGTGHWIYYSYQNEGFNFSKPEIMNGLFSYRKGWFVYTPVWILFIPGLFFLHRKNKKLPVFIFGFFLVYIFFIFSWWSWYYGGSFGSRAMIDIYPLLALPLAAFVNWAVNAKLPVKIAAGVLFVCFIQLNLFQTEQYKYGLIHWSQMDKDTYWKVWGKMKLTEEEWKFVSDKWKTNYKGI